MLFVSSFFMNGHMIASQYSKVYSVTNVILNFHSTNQNPEMCVNVEFFFVRLFVCRVCLLIQSDQFIFSFKFIEMGHSTLKRLINKRTHLVNGLKSVVYMMAGNENDLTDSRK